MFLGRLKGEIDPEVKRKIIGQAFLDAKSDVAKRFHLDDEVFVLFCFVLLLSSDLNLYDDFFFFY